MSSGERGIGSIDPSATGVGFSQSVPDVDRKWSVDRVGATGVSCSPSSRPGDAAPPQLHEVERGILPSTSVRSSHLSVCLSLAGERAGEDSGEQDDKPFAAFSAAVLPASAGTRGFLRDLSLVLLGCGGGRCCAERDGMSTSFR